MHNPELPSGFRDIEIVDPPVWLDEVLAEADAELASRCCMSFGSVEEFDAYARQVTANTGEINASNEMALEADR